MVLVVERLADGVSGIIDLILFVGSRSVDDLSCFFRSRKFFIAVKEVFLLVGCCFFVACAVVDRRLEVCLGAAGNHGFDEDVEGLHFIV